MKRLLQRGSSHPVLPHPPPPGAALTPEASWSRMLLLVVGLCACSGGASSGAVEALEAPGGSASSRVVNTWEAPGSAIAPWSASESIWSYGADPIEGVRPPLEGLAEFVSADRVLFGERLDTGALALSLVRTEPAGPRVLDQRVLDVSLERFFGSSDWSDRFTTFLVPLGPERVVVVGTRQRLELLGLEEDRITSLSRYPLHPASDSILAGVGRGDRFWTCSSFYVTEWRVEPDHTLRADPSRNIFLPGSCRSLALSEDGATLWAATLRGLVAVDLSRPTPGLRAQFYPQQQFFHVRLKGAHLVAQELVSYGGLGRILVFRAGDLTGSGANPPPVGQFRPVSEATRWERPVGFALTDAGLLVEWFRIQGSTRAYVVETHALTPEGVSEARGALTLRESEEVGLLLSPLAMSGGGRHAVLQPWRRLVEVDDTGVPRFQTGEGHGSLERVWVDAQGHLTAAGPFGAHRVVPTPGRGLVLLGGGQALPPETRRLRLLASDTTRGGWELMTLPAEATGVVQEAGTAVLSCLRQQLQGPLAPAGEVRLEGGPAALASVRGQLLQVAPMEGQDWRLRRFTVPADCPGTPLVPEQEVRLRGAVVEGVARSGWTIAADAERPELLLGEAYYQGPSAPTRLMLTWLSGENLDTVASGELSGSSGQFTALALARERALVIENRRQLYVLERDGERLRIQAHVDLTASESPLEVSRILAFDGEVAWLGVSSRPLGVVALRASDLATLARYETPGLVRSLAFTGGRLVLGMNNGLVLTEPVDLPQP